VRVDLRPLGDDGSTVAHSPSLEEIRSRLPTLEEIDAKIESGEWSDEGRELTEDEKARAREERAEKPIRNDLAAKGEQVIISLLKTQLFQAVNVRKAPTRLQNIFSQGHVVGQFRESVDVDVLSDRIPLLVNGDILWPALRCEVKSISGPSWPLSKLSHTEVSYLDDAVHANQAAWLALVWFSQTVTCKWCGHFFVAKRSKREVLCVQCKGMTSARKTKLDAYLIHLFSWRRWNLVLDLMQSRVAGNYQGKSIRLQEHPHLEEYAIHKVKGRWILSDNHWLRALLPSLHGLQPEYEQVEMSI